MQAVSVLGSPNGDIFAAALYALTFPRPAFAESTVGAELPVRPAFTAALHIGLRRDILAFALVVVVFTPSHSASRTERLVEMLFTCMFSIMSG